MKKALVDGGAVCPCSHIRRTALYKLSWQLDGSSMRFHWADLIQEEQGRGIEGVGSWGWPLGMESRQEKRGTRLRRVVKVVRGGRRAEVLTESRCHPEGTGKDFRKWRSEWGAWLRVGCEGMAEECKEDELILSVSHITLKISRAQRKDKKKIKQTANGVHLWVKCSFSFASLIFSRFPTKKEKRILTKCCEDSKHPVISSALNFLRAFMVCIYWYLRVI